MAEASLNEESGKKITDLSAASLLAASLFRSAATVFPGSKRPAQNSRQTGD